MTTFFYLYGNPDAEYTSDELRSAQNPQNVRLFRPCEYNEDYLPLRVEVNYTGSLPKATTKTLNRLGYELRRTEDGS